MLADFKVKNDGQQNSFYPLYLFSWLQEESIYKIFTIGLLLVDQYT